MMMMIFVLCDDFYCGRRNESRHTERTYAFWQTKLPAFVVSLYDVCCVVASLDFFITAYASSSYDAQLLLLYFLLFVTITASLYTAPFQKKIQIIIHPFVCHSSSIQYFLFTIQNIIHKKILYSPSSLLELFTNG